MRIFWLICLVCGLCGVAFADKKEWGYGEDSKQWADISELYLGCKNGNLQSPIKIITKQLKESKGSTFSLHYMSPKGVNLRLENHTFKIEYPKGSYIMLGADKYMLQEIHLKTPAENIIDTLSAIMEAQFHHIDSKGRRLVLSVMFVDGRSNQTLERLIKNLPTTPKKSHFITNFDANDLLPKNLGAYQFYGSLTYPPCSQNVYWIVLKSPLSATQSEVESFQNITGSNAREPQDVANRLIMQ